MNLIKVIDTLRLDGIFSNYRWYRSAKGGVWLKYWVSSCFDYVWFNVVEFDGVTRPQVDCLGIPVVETY